MRISNDELLRKFSTKPLDPDASDHAHTVIAHLSSETQNLLSIMLHHVSSDQVANRIVDKLEDALLLAVAEVRRTHGYDLLPPEAH